jgi:hypothetical protein
LSVPHSEPASSLAGGILGVLKALSGRGLKTRLLHPRDEFWDRRLGVHTFGFTPAIGEPEAPDFRVHYTPAPYATLFRLFGEVQVGPEDVVVDYGSGLGRPVFLASWLGAKRAIGVEIDASLVAAARRNFEGSRLRDRDIEFVCTSAERYTPKDVTVVYMFHPFGAGTMQGVVRALEADLAARPRRLRIAYENPIHAEIFDQSRVWKRIGGWPAGTSGSAYEAIFWEARGA